MTAYVTRNDDGMWEWRHPLPPDVAARDRAVRILTAAELAVSDKARPLFTGGAPLNTNPFDIDNYGE